MIPKIALFLSILGFFLISCDRSGRAANVPSPEMQELIKHGERVDALIAGFDEAIALRFPDKMIRPELKNGSASGFGFWLLPPK